MQNLVRILKSLADLNRLRIVLAIGRGSISVSEIMHATELPQPLVSFHLKALRNAEVVKSQRNGPYIYYSLSSPHLIDILSELSKTNASAASVDGGRFTDDLYRSDAGTPISESLRDGI